MIEFVYSNQNPAKFAPRVEKRLRQNLKAAAPLPYQVVAGEERPANFVNVMNDLGQALFGGRRESSVVCYLCFDLNQARPATLQASIDRVALGGAILGMLVYSLTLSKPVNGPVCLEDPKAFKKSLFSGEPALAEKLNSQPKLLKKVNSLAVTSGKIYGYTLEIPRLCRIEPQPNGTARLLVATLPRLKSLFSPHSTRVKEVFQLAELIEQSI